MTAVNAYAHRDTGLLVTDTAGYDESGVVGSFMGKVATFPRMRAAIATRGAISALPGFASAIDYRAETFDSLISDGAGIIEDAYHSQAEAMAELFREQHIQLTLVGWSEERRECQAYAMSSQSTDSVPAFTWWRQPVIVSPMPEMAELAAAGVLAENGGFADTDPIATMLKLVMVQRCFRSRMGTDESMPEAFTVGGDIILTHVGEYGITQRILHRFPDRVGEPINPHAGDKVVPLSREQSRRLKQRDRRAS